MAVQSAYERIAEITQTYCGSAFNYNRRLKLADNPANLRDALKTSPLRSLLRADGSSLSAAQASVYQPELGLVIGEAQVVSAAIQFAGKTMPVYENAGGISLHSGTETVRQMFLSFGFVHGTAIVYEQLGVQTSDQDDTHANGFVGKLVTEPYAEFGYNGHELVLRDGTQESVLEAVNYMGSLLVGAMPYR